MPVVYQWLLLCGVHLVPFAEVLDFKFAQDTGLPTVASTPVVHRWLLPLCRVQLVRFAEDIDFKFPMKKACSKELNTFCKDVPSGTTQEPTPALSSMMSISATRPVLTAPECAQGVPSFEVKTVQ